MSAFSLRLSSSCFALLASHLKNEMIVIMGFIFNVLIWQNIKLAILCWSTLPQIIFEIFLAYEKPESGSCWDGCYISTSWGGVMRKSLVGPRTRHPQIWHLGTVNGSGWRETVVAGRTRPPREAGRRPSCGNCSPYIWRKRRHLTYKDRGTRRGIPMNRPYYPELIPFCPITFPPDSPLSIERSRKMLKFISLCHIKTY